MLQAQNFDPYAQGVPDFIWGNASASSAQSLQPTDWAQKSNARYNLTRVEFADFGQGSSRRSNIRSSTDLRIDTVIGEVEMGIVDEWSNLERAIYVRDSSGRLETLEESEWDKFLARWLPFSRSQTTYDPQGLTSQTEFLIWNEDLETYELSERTHTVYNAQGNTLVAIDSAYIPATDTYFPFAKDTFVYDQTDRLTATFAFSYVGQTWLRDEWVTYRYDSLGRLVEVTEYSYEDDPEQFSSAIRRDYTFTDDDELNEIAVYERNIDENSWEPSLSERFFYNNDIDASDSRVSSSLIASDIESETRFADAPSGSQLFFWDEFVGRFLFFGSFIYTWSEIDGTTSTERTQFPAGSLSVFPNPAVATFQIEGNQAFNEASWTLVNAGGQALRSGVYSTGQSIPVADLPAGLYTVIIRDQSRFGAVKLMIGQTIR